MARRKEQMNEVVEIIYHWHQGNTIKLQQQLGF